MTAHKRPPSASRSTLLCLLAQTKRLLSGNKPGPNVSLEQDKAFPCLSSAQTVGNNVEAEDLSPNYKNKGQDLQLVT